MVQALENEGQEDTLRRITIDSRVIEMSSLEDFVSQNTRKFFSITGLSPDFLEREVVTWESDPEYLHIKNIVSSMRVVNDIAERGIALMEEYNKLRTQNEEQKQYLLLTKMDSCLFVYLYYGVYYEEIGPKISSFTRLGIWRYQ
ncbi:unnamed protein product, partial [Nesidiocoris tenuis]